MSHDIPNLGVIDGSVFVTSGAVNPTSTICALALRAARRLANDPGSIARPARHEATYFDLAPAASKAKASAQEPSVLTEVQADQLVRIGDALIPPVDDLPGAGTLMGHGGLTAKVLAARPDLRAPLLRALDQPDSASFSALAIGDMEAWMATLTVVAGAYYLDPRVRSRIGYEGQTARPVRPDNYPAFLEEGLLDHLLPST
jgi:hypothetical protein